MKHTPYKRYEKEEVENLIRESFSVAEVMRKLGLKESGGGHSHLSRRIKEWGIDTSHFLGQGSNKGKNHKGGPQKRSWQEVLLRRTSHGREDAFILRRALLESGRAYSCEKCNIGSEWNGQELRLQVDHINGDFLDNSSENLRFLCPNCHSQTNGYNGSRGIAGLVSSSKWGDINYIDLIAPYVSVNYIDNLMKLGKERIERNKKKERRCSCGNMIKDHRAKKCMSCSRLASRKVERPPYDVLLKELEKMSFCAVGRKYGVSDNAVRKWLKTINNG